ncbi:MAG: DedA family protein [Candidatus Pacearchaeota archaeon]
MLPAIIDFILHIDVHLDAIVSLYPTLSYLFLFLIIFVETGLVIMPFLPGDSLLFVVGALSAVGSLNILLSFFLLFFAAVLGDALNYHVGKYFGPRVFRFKDRWFFNKEHLLKAQEFYEKHGKKTIVLARFVPIVRTFAPFVAGIGEMRYKTFLSYNVIGALLWCGLFIFGGYFFGNIPFIQDNFGTFILIIIAVSLLPIVIELIRSFVKKR